MQQAFAFHVNGQDAQGEERFGEEWGVMLATDIPAFFVELGQDIAKENTNYDMWYEKHPDKLKEIAQKYI